MDRALNILGSPLEWNKEFPIGKTSGLEWISGLPKDVECRAAEYLSQRLICVYDFESSHGAFLGFTYTGGKITVHAANLEQTLQSIFLCFTSVFFTIRSHTLPRVFQTGVNVT